MNRSDATRRSLTQLLADLAGAAPEDRISLRDPILAFGAPCLAPLVELATREGKLSASVAAWLETLAGRDPSMKAEVIRALAALARGTDGEIARSALGRLGAPPRAPRTAAIKGPRPPSAAQAAVHARIIQAAKEGQVLTYSDLGTNRGHQGTFLLNISQQESDQGHPPLTSLVVSKTTGRPGDGYLPAMIEVGFANEGEKLEDVWGRAVAAVHSFWQGQPDSAGR